MKSPRQVGRPPEFDRAQALAAATAEFWRHGYSNATMDRLSRRMKMSKPSVYATFGGKEDLYAAALREFCSGLVGAVRACDVADGNVETALFRLFDAEIDFYAEGEPPRGCFLVCTAPAETANSEEIQAILSTTIRDLDKAFAKLLRRAMALGKLPPNGDVRLMAMSLQSVLQTLAIRIRAGESPRTLKKYVRSVIPQLLAPA